MQNFLNSVLAKSPATAPKLEPKAPVVVAAIPPAKAKARKPANWVVDVQLPEGGTFHLSDKAYFGFTPKTGGSKVTMPVEGLLALREVIHHAEAFLSHPTVAEIISGRVEKVSKAQARDAYAKDLIPKLMAKGLTEEEARTIAYRRAKEAHG